MKQGKSVSSFCENMRKNNLKIAVLVSGNGTNLQALINAIEAGDVTAEIACVISNNATAYALERATRHGIRHQYIDHKLFSGRAAYDARLVEVLKSYAVNLVILAGFMRIITPVLIDAFPHAIMNIHPALLPSFPGLHAQRQAIEYGVKVTGCTVHFVDSGTDTGPIILQSAVPVLVDDDEASLSARIQVEEHLLYPKAIRLFAEGCLKVEGRRVTVSPQSRPR